MKSTTPRIDISEVKLGVYVAEIKNTQTEFHSQCVFCGCTIGPNQLPYLTLQVDDDSRKWGISHRTCAIEAGKDLD